MIREYTEVLTAAAEEQAKEFALQGDMRHQYIQLQTQQTQQIGQAKFHPMQQSKNGSNTMQQNQTHFRHGQHGIGSTSTTTQLVPPQPS